MSVITVKSKGGWDRSRQKGRGRTDLSRWRLSHIFASPTGTALSFDTESTVAVHFTLKQSVFLTIEVDNVVASCETCEAYEGVYWPPR